MSAFVFFWKYQHCPESIEFLPLDPGQSLPITYQAQGKRAVFVDVCPLEVDLQSLLNEADVLILDHHESNRRRLASMQHPRLRMIFDMSKCGAELAWHECFPEQPVPWFIHVVADQDLWRWTHEDSKAYGAYLVTRGYYTDWKKTPTLFTISPEEKQHMRDVGLLFLEGEEPDIEKAVRSAICTQLETPLSHQKYRVYVVGAKRFQASEVGYRLCQQKNADCDFAVIWNYSFEKDEFWCSCRALKPEVDLSRICVEFGGGGHPTAAGFSVPNQRGALQTLFLR